MAATTVGDYQLTAKIIEGYLQAYLPEDLPLIKAGLVTVDTDAPKFASGNTWEVKSRKYDSTVASTPVAATDATVRSLSTGKQIGVVLRRGVPYGVEKFSAQAGGDSIEAFAADAARVMLHNANLTINSSFQTDLFPGLFAASGTLVDTHVVDNGTALSTKDFADAELLIGERAALLDSYIIHPTQYHKRKLADYVDFDQKDYELAREYSMTGKTYAGRMGGRRVFLDSTCYNDGTTYWSYLVGPGALGLGFQMGVTVEYDYLMLTGMGTHVWQYTMSYAPYVNKVSFTGTAPTGIGGATAANLSTVGNWTKITNTDASEIPIVCIKALAE